MQTDSVGPPAARAGCGGGPPTGPHGPTPGGEAVERLLEDEDWWLQPLPAGRRLRLRRRGADAVAVDEAGRLFRPPRAIAEAVLFVAAEVCVLDGVAVDAGGEGGGDAVVYHAFDLLERDGRDLRDLPYALRYDAAVDLVDAVPSDALRFAVTAVRFEAKRALLRALQTAGRDAAVFRHRLARGPSTDPAHRPIVLTFASGSPS